MNKVALLFTNFEKEHFGKDVFIVPYLIHKKENLPLEIAIPCSKTNKDVFNFKEEGVRFKKITPFYFKGYRRLLTLAGLFYLLINSRKIKTLITFHFCLQTALYIIVYKFCNNKGRAYVKLDIPLHIVGRILTLLNGNSLIISRVIKRFIHDTDLFTCETSQCYEALKNSSIDKTFLNKLRIMPNGFDESTRINLNINICTPQEKENLIITVGRLGNKDKNNEMFLRAIPMIKLSNWKIVFIGPEEEHFYILRNQFLNQNINLKDKVLFIGPIYNKKDLWTFYNKAKVFVFTSWRESYGLVLNEAYRFNNYIVSTDVGAARDIINSNNGLIISQDNAEELADVLNRIINGTINITNAYSKDKSDIFWDNLIDCL